MIVIDASVVLEGPLDDARAAESEALLIEAAGQGIVARPLFWLEVTNALGTRLKRGAVDAAMRDASIGPVRALGARPSGADVQADVFLDRTVAWSDR